MTAFNCPSCGAKAELKSSASLYVVCAYCQSYIVREDLDFKNLGKMSDLAEDSSPLQIGSAGVYGNKAFSVVGKNRLKWEDGFWNEWYLLFQDGTPGWLAEAQGDFIMSFEQKDFLPTALPSIEKLKVGLSFEYQGQQLFVTDIKIAESCGSLGELPFKADPGMKRTSADMRANTADIFGSLESDQSGASGSERLYLGRYVELKDLKMTFLREFDGW